MNFKIDTMFILYYISSAVTQTVASRIKAVKPIMFNNLRQPENVTNISTNPWNVRFRLYSNRSNYRDYKEVRKGEHFSLLGSKDLQLKVLVHGYTYNIYQESGFPHDTKDAYLKNTRHNVLLVDWDNLARPLRLPKFILRLLYPLVVPITPQVGEAIAEMLAFMVENNIISSPDLIHIMGYSLGAHVAGAAGHYFKEKTGQLVGRITGLDPSPFPLFRKFLHDTVKLDETDGAFVDVIHSSIIGIQRRIGHVDFYVNGGKFQSDCLGLSSVSEFFMRLRRLGSCVHGRAGYYFNFSIKKGGKAFSGCECNDWNDDLAYCRNNICKSMVEFGEHCPSLARGVFYFEAKANNNTR